MEQNIDHMFYLTALDPSFPLMPQLSFLYEE